MKIDRVLFCLNDNQTYTKFWNINSKIWKTKFNIIPTLIYVGEEEDIQKNKLSNEYGDILILPKYSKDLCKGSVRQWYITWALFYGATKFPDDICMTSGLDQIPLSTVFLEKIEDIKEDKYIVGFADAYGRKDLFPSSHHVGKGSIFKEKYEILDDWYEEIERIYQSRNLYKFHNLHDDYWGLDEAFSSDFLVKKSEDVHFINNFFHVVWNSRRIDRAHGLTYDLKKLEDGWYTELHSPRPYELYRQQIDQIIFIAHEI